MDRGWRNNLADAGFVRKVLVQVYVKDISLWMGRIPAIIHTYVRAEFHHKRHGHHRLRFVVFCSGSRLNGDLNALYYLAKPFPTSP